VAESPGAAGDATAPEPIDRMARDGADSVFEYLVRTAQPAADGVCWLTDDYPDESVPYDGAVHLDGAVFLGVAGIPLFLAAYARMTGETRAIPLAAGAARWSSAPGRTFTGDWHGPDESLCFGRAGAGLAWTHLWRVTGEAEHLAPARAAGERTLAAPLGPATDFIGGAAGEGTFLLQLWEATGEERFLAGAVRRADWLDGVATRDAAGCHWPWRLSSGGAAPGRTLLGFAHGVSGIGHYFLRLHAATGEARWADVAREVASTLARAAAPDRGGLNWRHFLDAPPREHARECQWCHGSPGVGLFYATAYAVLGDAAHLRAALAAGETTFAYGDARRNPSQCHGLAGNGELFLELYRLTGDTRWRHRAGDFAARTLGYRRPGPGGDVWQGDDPLSVSPDFLCGAAGVGHYFLRLLARGEIGMPLLSYA
jgi:lantibiotic modifying enzyme